MPGWSTEIANEFLRLAAANGRQLDQLQLQALVYIAHGWRLASVGEPLTGDRPEAREAGPVYRRLLCALAEYGLDPVDREVVDARTEASGHTTDQNQSGLDQSERDLIAKVYQNLGAFESWRLAALTRKGDTPWMQIYEAGAGASRDIPHKLIKAQFVEFFRRSERWSERRRGI